jgi:hypothetical protein
MTPRMRAKHYVVTNYWLAFYVNHQHCSLCGNSGVIDTRGVETAAGVPVGRLNFCICPNGQARRDALPTGEQEGGPR